MVPYASCRCSPKAYEPPMYVHSLSIHGLADLPAFRADDLGRQVHIRGPSPEASAIGDGLALAFAALSERALRGLLRRWGLIQFDDEAEIAAEGLPVQATWTDQRSARRIVADSTSRTVHARVVIALDPPLAAELRAHAVREPRLAVGLDGSPRVTIEVSAFFGASWDVLSISVQSVVIGGERFSTGSGERAPWTTALLKRIGERFTSHDETTGHAEVALRCLISADEVEHAPLQSWRLITPPTLGEVRVAQLEPGRGCFLSDGRLIRRYGPRMVEALNQTVSASLMGADVLWVGAPELPLDNLTEDPKSPLEQVWAVVEDGSIDPRSRDTIRSILPFAAGEE